MYVRVQNVGSRSASLYTVRYKYVRKYMYVLYGIRLHYPFPLKSVNVKQTKYGKCARKENTDFNEFQKLKILNKKTKKRQRVRVRAEVFKSSKVKKVASYAKDGCITRI